MKRTFFYNRCQLLVIIAVLFASSSYAQYHSLFQSLVQSPYTNYLQAFTKTVTDAQGNIIVAGNFDGTITLGSTTLTQSNSSIWSNNVLAKMDANGNWLWAIKLTGTNEVYLNSMCVDNSGNIAVTGMFKGTATFGNISITSSSQTTGKGKNASTQYSPDMFVAKISSTGTVLWAKQEGSNIDAGWGLGERGWGVTTDAGNNVYATGQMVRVMAKDGYNDVPITDVYVVKYNGAGVKQWEKNFGSGATKVNQTCGSGFEIYGSDIKVDGTGNVYLAGMFCKSLNFGSGHSVTATAPSCFTAKLDNAGNTQWLRAAIGANSAPSVLIDGSGDVYSAGGYGNAGISFGNISLPYDPTYYRNGYVVKYTVSGNFAWAKNFRPPNGLFRHPSGNLGFYDDESVLQINPASGAVVSTESFAGAAGRSYILSVTSTSNGFVFSGVIEGSVSYGNITLSGNCPVPHNNSCYDWVNYVLRYSVPTIPQQRLAKPVPQENHSGIFYYPNPVKDFLSISTKNNEPIGWVKVYDQTGRLVLEKNIGETQSQLDLKSLADGLYILKSEQLQDAIRIQKQ